MSKEILSKVVCCFPGNASKCYKKPCYKGLLNIIELQLFNHKDEIEIVQCTWLTKGAYRDVYVGTSRFLGKFVLKLHDGNQKSNDKEVHLCENGFANLAVEILHNGPAYLDGKLYCILIEPFLPTVSAEFSRLCNKEPDEETIGQFLSIIFHVIQLWRNTQTAQFTFLDAGPHNLGYIESESRAVFIDFEHSEPGTTKRTIWNQSFHRLITEAATCMATTPAWGVIGTPLIYMAKDTWWMNIADATMFGEDRLWLDNGLFTLSQHMLNLMRGARGTPFLFAVAPNLPTPIAVAPKLPTPPAAAPELPSGGDQPKMDSLEEAQLRVTLAVSALAESALAESPTPAASEPLTPMQLARAQYSATGLTYRIEPTAPGSSIFGCSLKVSASMSVAASSNDVAPLQTEAERSASTSVAASSNDVAPPQTEPERLQKLNSIWRMYQAWNPDKLVDDGFTILADKYFGREAEWLQGMKDKYFTDVKSSGWDFPAEEVRQHIGSNQGQRNRGIRVDGSSGDFRGHPEDQRPRMDFETRLQTGEWEYEPKAARKTGDAIAPMLVAWHTAVNPFAMQRTGYNKEGQYVRSTWDTPKFVQDNMAFATELFRTIAGADVPETDWLNVCYVREVIVAMLNEARLGKYGKWQWWEFHLSDEEVKELSVFILRAYIAGSVCVHSDGIQRAYIASSED